ncbi:MAG TPA: ribosome recycling factor [Flavobacteriales bacterium]|jgi:ribosome recycling factor|nr:ribosome recycling factor [Salibacteraceae bacterium]HAS36562.1 ribosome recycling factor [Flavobacteriales bacterium]
MNEDLEMIYDVAEEAMSDSIEHLKKELTKIRAGKASPAMVEGVSVDYYGSQTPLNQVSNVNTPDARTISIQPWEKAMLAEIEKAIVNSNLGLTPHNNGELIIINVPSLTTERRQDLVKQAKGEGEHAKVGIRNARKEANDEIKKLEKAGLSEDIAKDAEETIQKKTDAYNKKVEDFIHAKEEDILKV